MNLILVFADICIYFSVGWLVQSMPNWWKWYSWVNPVAYSLYGLIASQFGDIEDKNLKDVSKSVKKFIEDYFGFEHGNVWAAATAVFGFAVLFTITFAFSIRAFNFQRR